MSKNIIWTKDACVYCVKAKKLLKSNRIEYEERNINTSNWTREDMVRELPEARTFPQIIIDGVHIGGFSELHEKI